VIHEKEGIDEMITPLTEQELGQIDWEGEDFF